MTAPPQRPPVAFKPGDRVRIVGPYRTGELGVYYTTVNGMPIVRLDDDDMHRPFGADAVELEPAPPPAAADDGLRGRIADPICIGQPTIDRLAKEGAVTFADGRSLVAADDLFQASPYATIATHLAEIEALQAVLISKGAEVKTLKAENEGVRVALGPTVRFMDPPDGGDPTLGDMVQNMHNQLKAAEATIGKLRDNAVSIVEGMKPELRDPMAAGPAWRGYARACDEIAKGLKQASFSVEGLDYFVLARPDWGIHDVTTRSDGRRWCARCGVLETTCSLEGMVCRPIVASDTPYNSARGEIAMKPTLYLCPGYHAELGETLHHLHDVYTTLGGLGGNKRRHCGTLTEEAMTAWATAESRATRAEAECERMKGAVEAENEACALILMRRRDECARHADSLMLREDQRETWAELANENLDGARAIRARRASSTLAAIKASHTPSQTTEGEDNG